MRSVHLGPVIGLVGQLALLAVLGHALGLGGAGWLVGIGYGLIANALLAVGLQRRGRGLGPADRVTLARAVLVGGVAALVVDSVSRPVSVPVLVSLASIALALDAVDGRVARGTATVSRLGARFDMEVDAVLMLVLSGYVARFAGGWVLLIGLARYGLIGAGWLAPWLRAAAPPRHWCKVVAAIGGITLAVAAADVLPRTAAKLALAAVLVLLIESFGREVCWLWQHRAAAVGAVAPRVPVGTALAVLSVWFALLAPAKLGAVTPQAFLRIPLEAALIGAVALLLRPRARRAVAAALGALLGLALTLKALNMGFLAVFDRPFDVLNDWFYLGPGIGVLGDSIGRSGAMLVVIALAGLIAVVVLIVLPLSVVHLARLAAAHRRRSARAIAAIALAWLLSAAIGLQFGSAGPVASASTADLFYGQLSQLRHDIVDRQQFSAAIGTDRLHSAGSERLLTGLRGKDVVLAFVESYGRVAVQGSSFAPGVDAVLAAGTRQLATAGFSARSAFLTSPTFGAGSWLAHATLQSGLWVDSQQRYNQLLTRDRLTLTRAFGRAGWRTVFDVPANTIDWPQGSRFYRFDQLYDARNVGYRGPRFGYATMPDQYVLAALDRLELTKADRAPVMAEVDLVSSHHPWTPLPQLVPWHRVGDGSAFDAMPARGQSPQAALQNSSTVRALYGKSIEYTLRTLFSFVRTQADPNLVLIVVGDHQPHSYVSGANAGHDVPISIIAHDPAVLRGVDDWGWQRGMSPDPQAPVWPMSAFRDRFLTAFSPELHAAPAGAAAATGSPAHRQ